MNTAARTAIVLAFVLVATVAAAETRYVAGYPCDSEGIPHFPPGDPPGDTLYSFPLPSPSSNGLARQGDWFWNCDYGSGLLYRLDSTGAVDTTLPRPASATTGGGMEWDGTNLWFIAEQDARLFKLDPATGAVLDSFSLPDSASGDPNSWGLAWDGQYLWHSQYGAGRARIFKLDPATGAVLYSFPPPRSSILGIAWDYGYLCGVDIGRDVLYRMNPADSSVVDSTPWLLPHALGLIWDGNCLWNVDGTSDRVYRVNWFTGITAPAPRAAPARLLAAAPNPFRDHTTIRSVVDAGRSTDVTVLDCAGRRVRTLRLEPGSSTVTWDGTDDRGRAVAGGVYFVGLRTPGRDGPLPVLLVR